VESRNAKQQTKIWLCGRMAVEVEGRTVVPPGGQGRKLLAYLVANRFRPLRRDELHEVLWEGKPPADPDNGLNAALSRLRRELGPEVLPRGEVSLRLPGDAWVDVEVIEDQAQRTAQALEEGNPDEAVLLAEQTLELMKGFLPGLEARWIDERRRELAELRLSVQEAAVGASLQLGGARLPGALRMAQTLVREAPYREKGHELLMRVHAARGNVAEANRVFHSLRSLLRDELGTTPGPDITALNERLLLQERLQEEPDAAPARPAPERPAAPPPPEQVPLPPLLASTSDEGFVGRDEALARLSARWEKVSFRPRAVALTGEPGIGKTRLAASFSRRVHGAGHPVLYGRCDEDPLTSYQPFVEALDHYAGVRDLLRELRHEAEELRRLPGLRRRLPDAGGNGHSAVAEDRYALFEAIVAVFRRAAETRPLLLVVDDLHWADDPTFKLLLHLVRSLEPQRCMFLLTFRDVDTSPSTRSDAPQLSLEDRLAALRREAEVERVSLEGLSERDTAALVSVRRGSAPWSGFARNLAERTGGNPFFIEEALRSLVERDELAGEAEPDLDRLGVLQGVEEVITRRLNRLSSGSSDVIAMASVIGPEFKRSLLEAVIEQPPGAILEALEELIHDGLIVEVPGKPDHFAFAHGLLRETAYRRLIPSRQREMHERVALELERRAREGGGEEAATPGELAHHFYAARPRVDAERAAEYSIEAARHARRSGAYEEAIGHYGRALELLEGARPDELQICDILLRRGRVQLRAGRLKEARGTFSRAADIARQTRAVDRLALAALGYHGMYTAAGEVDRKRIDLLEEAEAALESADSPLRVRVLARLADSLLWVARDRALELSGEAVAMARRLDDTNAIREALGGRHAALLHAEHLEERRRVSQERLELAVEAGNPEAEAEALRWCMNDLCERGEVRAAKEHFARLDELARELRQPQYSSYVSHWACVFAQLHGRWAEAERLSDEAFELAQRSGAQDAEMSRLDKRYSIYREQGRALELRPAVERFAEGAPTLIAWRALAALLAAQAGDVGQARAEVERLVDDGGAAIPRDVAWLYCVAALAETCALLDDCGEPAAVLYSLLLPYAEHCVQIGMDVFWGSASRFLGLTATARGDWEAAERHFSVAERSGEEIGSPPLLARTLVDHADMLLRRGERTDADPAARLLARATSLAEPLGMTDLCRRADALGARAGTIAAPA
jgi:DNA-binding SARP family transcriptional activator/KaiC/GvpD/RAD55 family RecA-like ATPase